LIDCIIFTDKPYVARACAPFLTQRYSPERALVVCLSLAGPLQFRYPRGYAYADYPAVSEPQYEYYDAPYLRARSLADYEAWARERPVEGVPHRPPIASMPLVDVQDAIRQARRFVYSGDPSPSPAHGCFRLLEFLGVEDARRRTEAYILSDLSDKGLSKVFGAGSTPQSLDYLLHLNESGKVKRYFDWNWNHNALVVLGSALRAVGLPADVVISKYELQLLYFLTNNPVSRETSPWTEGRIVHAMSHWKGSGKYAERQYLGSAASRDAIIQHLIQKEFIGKRPVADRANTLFVTARAQSFLSFLHPDCEDPDLPVRIDGWMEAGFDASRPAIDRYIKTYFGKQKRFYAKSRAA
jgi:hypothetical protein